MPANLGSLVKHARTCPPLRNLVRYACALSSITRTPRLVFCSSKSQAESVPSFDFSLPLPLHLCVFSETSGKSLYFVPVLQELSILVIVEDQLSNLRMQQGCFSMMMTKLVYRLAILEIAGTKDDD